MFKFGTKLEERTRESLPSVTLAEARSAGWKFDAKGIRNRGTGNFILAKDPEGNTFSIPAAEKMHVGEMPDQIIQVDDKKKPGETLGIACMAGSGVVDFV